VGIISQRSLRIGLLGRFGGGDPRGVEGSRGIRSCPLEVRVIEAGVGRRD
jgi:hypothetical protein